MAVSLETKERSGEEALALGALDARVDVVTGYPGAPSQKVVAELEARREGDGFVVEWSANERVAFEIGLGAAILGKRALLCCKSVGINVLMDPFMVANLTGVKGGLVLLSGDDPGGRSTQNEQDNRFLAAFVEIPCLEPSTPQEGYDMMRYAFGLSQEYKLPVMLRETSAYAVSRGEVLLREEEAPSPPASFEREGGRWVCVNPLIVPLHRELHEKMERISRECGKNPFCSASIKGPKGVIASGAAWAKLSRVLKESPSREDLSLLKLGMLNALPEALICDFLKRVEEALVVEDGGAFLERELMIICKRKSIATPISGKLSGEIPLEGELTGELIASSLREFLGSGPEAISTPPEQEREAPSLRGFCEGCPYVPFFESLAEVMEELGPGRPIISSDTGCALFARRPPFELLDSKVCLGSAIGVAAGMAKAAPERPILALIGDSAFLHSGLPALIDAAFHRAPMLVVILDNSTTAMTGCQPHPGTDIGVERWGYRTVSLEGIVRALPLDFVRQVDPFKREEVEASLREGLARRSLGVIIVKSPCILLKP